MTTRVTRRLGASDQLLSLIRSVATMQELAGCPVKGVSPEALLTPPQDDAGALDEPNFANGAGFGLTGSQSSVALGGRGLAGVAVGESQTTLLAVHAALPEMGDEVLRETRANGIDGGGGGGAEVGVLLSFLRARSKAAGADLHDFVGDPADLWAPKMLELEIDGLHKVSIAAAGITPPVTATPRLPSPSVSALSPAPHTAACRSSRRFRMTPARAVSWRRARRRIAAPSSVRSCGNSHLR